MTDYRLTPDNQATEVTADAEKWKEGEDVFKRVWNNYQRSWVEDAPPEKVEALLAYQPVGRAFIIDEFPGQIVAHVGSGELAAEMELTPDQADAAIEYWRVNMVNAVNDVARRYQNKAWAAI